MSNQSMGVYRYLIFLQKYLLGDLLLFHKLAQQEEKKERKINEVGKCVIFKSIVELFWRKPLTQSIETTKYPYSFEFMFGRTIISRSTIPHTAILFSTIDILGFLNRRDSDYKNTTKNFEEFFRNPLIPIRPLELEILIKVFRHGMTHTYFPKLNMEISYHSSNPTGLIFFKNPGGDLILNVNTLEGMVIEQLQKIIDNSELYENMNSQLQIIVHEYERESRAKIEELKGVL